MARFICIFIGVILLNGLGIECEEDSEEAWVTTTQQPHCGDNETLDQCPVDCPSDYCPKSRHDDQSKCPNPKKCPAPACKCGFNSRRARNGTCINTRDCPPFKCKGPNEEYNACPPYCPGEDCSQATPDGKCHIFGRIGIVVECRPACRCKKNFWRLNGTCVPYDQCPNINSPTVTTEKSTKLSECGDTVTEPETSTTETPSLMCSDNEIADNCPVDCPSDYCPKSQKDENALCSRPEKCPPPACKCRFNHRRANNGTCIKTTNCPPFKCRGLHEEYNSCPPYCPGEDCSQATPDGKCHSEGRIGIVLECRPACRCKKNFWRLKGTCVPYNQCPKNNDALIKTEKPTTEETTHMTSTVKPLPKCEPDEIIDTCPVECPINYCPKSENVDFTPCPRPEKCAPPECRCGLGTHRAENGTCVPIQDCPPFECSRPNEEYRACYPDSSGEDCINAVSDEGAVSELKNLICKPACRCKKGYWRLNSACVPYEQCKRSPCGQNEQIVSCKNSCSDSPCPRSEKDSQPRFCPAVCLGPGCACLPNYRRTENGTCIPTVDCPPFDCSARPNEMYDPCPPICPDDSCSQATPSGECPNRFGRIGIRLICNPKCRCKKGYWRNVAGVCIPYEKCPKTCPENEEYNDCTQKLCGAQKDRAIVCSDKIPEPCKSGCVCKKGYLRNKNGVCVLEDKSEPEPAGVCPANEIYTNCSERLCRPQNCSDIADGNWKFTCEPGKVQGCQAGCVCKEGSLRSDNGTCVSFNQCGNSNPIQCTRPYEEYTDCKKTCPGDTCSALTSRFPCEDECCEPGCVCSTGYRRQTSKGPCVPLCECQEMASAPACKKPLRT